MAFESINPATGGLIRRYEAMSPARLTAALDRAETAFASWRRTEFEGRSARLRVAARRLRARRSEFARLMAIEMGKPLAQGEAEIDKCALVCDYYADRAQGFLASEPVQTDAARSYVAFQPLGVVLAVMPWNFPFWQVFRFLAPGLMAGNTAVLKHASNVMGCALAIEDLLRDAEVPAGVFQTLLIGSADVAAAIEHRAVRAVTLTGSTPAGRAVAAAAGALLKKTVLELGGSDPYLVLDDRDLGKTAAACADSRLINSGQSCVAAKRFIVVESVRQAFEEAFVAAMRAKRMGDPLEPGVQVGPMARHDLRDEIHAQVQRSVDAGARLLLGGEVPDGPGAFYPPTVLTGVRKGMPVYDEEVFGPVASIIGVADVDEAVRVANDSPFGLGAAVFAGDVPLAERIAAEELEAGCCFVNTFVRSDPRLPFGGVKESGYGRELAAFGIREFVNVKTVYIA